MHEKLEKPQLREMYLKMLHTRKFEEKVAYLFSMGMVHGTTHLYAGEEACAIGSTAALDVEDIIISTHRGHGHCIGKGIDLGKMMAELLGKEDGYCKGKGGSMHIADLSRNNLGANGVVGGGIPLAVGAALSIKMRNEDRVMVCFFGDGASNEGSFHEALNLASIWKLPLIFILENNQYGMSGSVKRMMNVEDLSVRASSYGMKGVRIDGNNIFEVYDTVMDAKDYVKTQGPILIVAETYRYMGHSKSDANVYRTKEEIAAWREKCPIKRMRLKLLEDKAFDAAELDALEEQAQNDIDRATEWASSRPEPELSSLLEDVYA